MSKAFTKEDDGTAPIRLDDLPQSPHPNLVTPSGLADLRHRLETRKQALADLREGPAETDGGLAVAVVERDIRFLESRINRAILVDPKNHPPGIVAFGAEVDVITEEGTTRTFRIVGEEEAEPSIGLITPYSPLGVALMGAELDSLVEWQKPTGAVDLEVVAIRFL